MDDPKIMQNNPVPFLDLVTQARTLRAEVDAAFDEILTSAWYVRGPKVDAFEAAFAEYCNVDHALGVSSGTAALELAIRACEIGVGDEVITVSHTFAATVAAVAMTGATPVLVDVNRETYTMDPAAAEAAVTDRTRAILPVHLYGQPADMDLILAIAERYGLRVIEDAAQAHGAVYRGRRAGSMGHLACFSFYPGKNLGAYGEAGAVVGRDAELMDRVRLLHDHGARTKYEHVLPGFNHRMEAFQGAVLGIKLPHLDDWTALRQERAGWYDELLAGTPAVTPAAARDRSHVYHLYVIQVDDRDALQEHLAAQDIATGIHYPTPVHLQPGYAFLGYGAGDLPVTESVSARILSLPMYPELTRSQVERVVEAVREGLGA
jgi:dTDP-4-amino-4,6-dideoxygalactose transaminase